jgi:hypothetical protein
LSALLNRTVAGHFFRDRPGKTRLNVSVFRRRTVLVRRATGKDEADSAKKKEQERTIR